MRAVLVDSSPPFLGAKVDLATHDAGGITALAVKLAHSMEALAASRLTD